MTKRQDFIDALTAVLREAGATEIELGYGGKHPRLNYVLNGEQRYRALPNTPSDSWYGLKKAVAELRREVGLASNEKRVGERRIRRPHTARRLAELQPALPLTELPGHVETLKRHPAAVATIQRRLWDAWNALWRNCMARAGGESLL